MKTIHTQFYSDFICPWCYLGKTRFEKIRVKLENEIEIKIELKPYVLYPFIPKGGLPKSDFAKKTKPGMGKSLREEAKKEGIQFNYKNIEQIPNSLEAHRLIELVSEDSKKYELALKIFYSYFEEGKNIEDLEFLVELAKSIGVSEKEISDFQLTNKGTKEVDEQIQEAKEDFISLVPSLKINHKILIPGLQSDEVWEKYLRRAANL